MVSETSLWRWSGAEESSAQSGGTGERGREGLVLPPRVSVCVALSVSPSLVGVMPLTLRTALSLPGPSENVPKGIPTGMPNLLHDSKLGNLFVFVFAFDVVYLYVYLIANPLLDM